MKNKIPLLYILLLLSSITTHSLFAQDDVPLGERCYTCNEDVAGAWKIGVWGGTAIPFGNYSHYTSRALGNASVGSIVGIDLYHTIHRNLAIGISVNHLFNPINAEKWAEGIWEENKTASNVKLTATPYQVANVMLGLRPQTALLLRNVSVFGGIAGGVMFVKSPTSTQEIALSSPLHQTIEGATSTAFCAQFQGGIQYHLNCKWGLSLVADYLTAKPTFDFVRSDKANTPTESVALRMQTLNIGLKLAYLLSNGKAQSKS